MPFSNKNVIKYKTGDGNDTINGYNETDTLKISGDYSTQTSGFSDVLINVGSGSILLKYASGKKININKTSETVGKLNEEIITYTLPSDLGTAQHLISGTSGDDKLYNTESNAIIAGGAGNDLIYIGRSGGNTISGGVGNDTIKLGSSNITEYKTGDGNDFIEGFGETSSLQIGDGKATYHAERILDDVVLTVGAGKISLIGAGTLDSLNVIGKKDSSTDLKIIYGTEANDSIYRKAGDSSTVISSGAGNDYIHLNYDSSIKSDDKIFVYSGAGDDQISLNSVYYTNKNLIQYKNGDGNDKIFGFDKTSSLKIGNGKATYHAERIVADIVLTVGDGKITLVGAGTLDSLNIVGKKDSKTNLKIINGTSSNDTIYNSELRHSKISGGKGNDYIYNYDNASNVSILGGAGNDSISNSGANSTLDGGAGNDSIANGWFASKTKIIGGDGNDYIWNDGGSIKISSGKDNDTIYNCSDKVTISASTGDDNIYNHETKNVIISAGDGNDTIFGFGHFDTLKISDADYSTTTSGSDCIIKVGKGKITLKDAASVAAGLYGLTVDVILTNKSKSEVTLGAASKVADASSRKKTIKITGNKLANSIVGGKGNDTLWGGKGNDSLWGDDGADTFIYGKGDGKDFIYGFDDKDTLTLDNLNFTTSYKNGAITFKVDGGSVTLKDFFTTTFHVNSDIYKISGSKLKKQ
ncbi:MAG: hypothetical protein IKN16_09305 [Selenomonadaceae bacterium]|nr:hypothetical protein [Selenomonadaceae bacterium]